jgi:hypothetical protein
MNIDDLVSAAEAAEWLGTSKRLTLRILARLRAQGIDPTIRRWGLLLIPRSFLGTMKDNHYPLGSDQRHKAAVEFGRRGGTKKALNRLRRKEGAS